MSNRRAWVWGITYDVEHGDAVTLHKSSSGLDIFGHLVSYFFNSRVGQTYWGYSICRPVINWIEERAITVIEVPITIEQLKVIDPDEYMFRVSEGYYNEEE